MKCFAWKKVSLGDERQLIRIPWSLGRWYTEEEEDRRVLAEAGHCKNLISLEKYLDAYTTALKAQPFSLLYIDAFAGTGNVELQDGEVQQFVSGSAQRAINVTNKQFDKLVFVEQDPVRCSQLNGLMASYRGRDIVIENSDANWFLENFDHDWDSWRGVLFLDPFATEVAWSTIEKIAGLNALDTWILFPVSAIARMLPVSRKPDDISDAWVRRLTTVFGDDSWRGLYQQSQQGELFGAASEEREPGVDGLFNIYKTKLSDLFGSRFLDRSKTLRNSKNSPLFEFLFCVGSEKGISPAKRIADYLLQDL